MSIKALPVSSTMPFVMNAPPAPVPRAAMSNQNRHEPLVNTPAPGVRTAEPITVDPHFILSVSESEIVGSEKNPCAWACKTLPLVNVLAAMVLEPVTIPITEVSAAESFGPAVVVDENTVEPVPELPPPVIVQSVLVAPELSAQDTPLPVKFRVGRCVKGVPALSTVW